jgi:hypothetical protein
MKRASEYRQHAEECRALAGRMEGGEARDQLLRMAATWEELARERSAVVRRHPELGADGEAQEEAAAAEGLKRS